MNPLIQPNIKNISKLIVPMNYGVGSVANFRRLLSSKKHVSCLSTKFQSKLIAGEIRNKSTSEKLFSNTLSSNSLDVNSLDEDKNSSVSSGSADIIYRFKNECDKQEQFLTDQLQIKNERSNQMSNQEWDVIRHSVLKMFGTINDKSVDAVIMNKCVNLKSLSLGKSYFKYLKTTQKLINRATYGNYLRLFFSCKDDCTGDHLNEILAVYNELIDLYPLLDSNTAEKAICALSITTNWKEYEKLFIAIKQYYRPTVYIYKIVIETAFDNQEFDLGWKLMEEMQYQGLDVPEEVFLYWFDKVKFRKLEGDLTKVLEFFNFFNRKPTDEVCEGIKKAFEEFNEEKKGTFTRIARNGECRSCHLKLEPCYLSQEDFSELKKAFLNPVIIGKDIFQKTKPEEFIEFLNFLKKSSRFDVVLDGLNVARHGRGRSVSDYTFRLKSVVKYFVTRNKKVLVLGRKHMATWHTPHMKYVNDNARLFLADNLSQDDPFMLYSALYSGLGTCFVSRDLMRGHKFLLADHKLQITFQKWQSQHQYFITKIEQNGRVYFQEPVSFLQTIQQNSKGDWHIPYVLKGEELTSRDRVDHLHRHWLCLQNKSPLAPHKQIRLKEPNTKPEKTKERGWPTKKSAEGINIKNIFRDDDR